MRKIIYLLFLPNEEVGFGALDMKPLLCAYVDSCNKWARRDTLIAEHEQATEFGES